MSNFTAWNSQCALLRKTVSSFLVSLFYGILASANDQKGQVSYMFLLTNGNQMFWKSSKHPLSFSSDTGSTSKNTGHQRTPRRLFRLLPVQDLSWQAIPCKIKKKNIQVKQTVRDTLVIFKTYGGRIYIYCKYLFPVPNYNEGSILLLQFDKAFAQCITNFYNWTYVISKSLICGLGRSGRYKINCRPYYCEYGASSQSQYNLFTSIVSRSVYK